MEWTITLAALGIGVIEGEINDWIKKAKAAG